MLYMALIQIQQFLVDSLEGKPPIPDKLFASVCVYPIVHNKLENILINNMNRNALIILSK